jgi:hypothetical protein
MGSAGVVCGAVRECAGVRGGRAREPVFLLVRGEKRFLLERRFIIRGARGHDDVLIGCRLRSRIIHLCIGGEAIVFIPQAISVKDSGAAAVCSGVA